MPFLLEQIFTLYYLEMVPHLRFESQKTIYPHQKWG